MTTTNEVKGKCLKCGEVGTSPRLILHTGSLWYCTGCQTLLSVQAIVNDEAQLCYWTPEGPQREEGPAA